MALKTQLVISARPAKIQKQLKHAGFQHVTLRLFPTLRHEILLETEKATVFQEIGHWLTDLTKVDVVTSTFFNLFSLNRPYKDVELLESLRCHLHFDNFPKWQPLFDQQQVLTH